MKTMKIKLVSPVAVVSIAALLLLSAVAGQAQETSRQIPFTNLATTLPQRSTQSLTVQLQDAAGAVLFAESQSQVAVDNKSQISFFFGALTIGGLDPAHFTSGSSRFVDVVDGAGVSVLAKGRIALNAAAFTLSPGPEGPQGPEGPPGPAGPAGPAGSSVNVSAGDSSIVVGGTPTAPTVAVATNGISNTKVADGALSPVKIAGTAATLGANIFNGSQNITGALNATGLINTGTQYNISGNRVLSIPGAFNIFAGVSAGQDNTTGSLNAFFGNFAGQKTTSGSSNSFFGLNAGQNNATGSNNSFFGNTAGLLNTASDNSFFGAAAGLSNTAGDDNAFFGSGAGRANQDGFSNSFFGRNAGLNNLSNFNSFFGASAGELNTTGFRNAFFGDSAGRNNTEGKNNAFFGEVAGLSNTTGIENSFFGSFSAERNMTGSQNAFFGFFAGRSNTTGVENAFFGNATGRSNTSESHNTYIGASSNGAPGITNATALGADAVVLQSNSVVLGRNDVSVGIGSSEPKAKLHVQGGSILVGSAGSGIILKSPNGATCRRLTINDAGLLITTAVACP